MAIPNLNRLLQQKNINFESEIESKVISEKAIEMMFHYMEESFKKMIEMLEVINKNQLLLLNEIKKGKEE